MWGKRMKIIAGIGLGVLIVCSPAYAAEAAEPVPELVHGRWLGAMGASGVRRSLANGSDLGELINRSTSYKMAAQVDGMRKRQQAAGLDLPSIDFDSETDAWVAQSGSLFPLIEGSQRNLSLRASVRRAERYEDERVDARADRIELGLFSSTVPGYLGLSAVVERTKAELGFIRGNRDADGLGLRLDYGRILNETWAVSGRLEHVWWDGDGRTYIPSRTGTVLVTQDTSFERNYLNLEFIGRYELTLPFAANGQLRWRSGLHYLRNGNDRQVNSLGQVVEEPFGELERLGLLRTGAYYSWRAGQEQRWSPYVELTYDYEFENNMDSIIQDPHTLTAKAGLARLIKPGWRAQLDVQRYQSLNGERVRNGATLAVVMDL